MSVQIYNTGVLDFIKPVIMLELDSLLELEMASVPYDELGENKFLLHAADIPPGLYQRVRLEVKTACDAPFGYVHCSTAALDNVLCNLDTAQDTFCIPNGAAIDPNFKVDGSDFSFDLTEIVDDSPIEYQIHFQNTGTSYAHRVTIRDTLPEELNAASFVFKGSSHPVEITLLENHILQFFFDGINLPDSLTDEPGSHGVIVFEMQPVGGLIVGDTILNSSAIYFDFSPPVITNSKRHAVSCGYEIVAEAISITPDEGGASGSILITMPDSIAFSFLWSTGDTTSQLTNIASGVYWVTITNTKGCERVLEFEVPFLTFVIEPDSFIATLRPNPAGSHVYIQTSGVFDALGVDIFSFTGQMMMSQSFTGPGSHRLDVEALPPAVYFCRVQTANGMRVMKFVKR
jgi:uncharacterized repeat protein (TIGR01451 family)